MDHTFVMRKISAPKIGIIVAAFRLCGGDLHAAGSGHPTEIDHVVDEAIRHVMEENNVAGMAVAFTARGKQYCFNDGVAWKESGRKANVDTICEIGSVRKTFTATLAYFP